MEATLLSLLALCGARRRENLVAVLVVVAEAGDDARAC
jgi:hypothetical protein